MRGRSSFTILPVILNKRSSALLSSMLGKRQLTRMWLRMWILVWKAAMRTSLRKGWPWDLLCPWRAFPYDPPPLPTHSTAVYEEVQEGKGGQSASTEALHNRCITKPISCDMDETLPNRHCIEVV